MIPYEVISEILEISDFAASPWESPEQNGTTHGGSGGGGMGTSISSRTNSVEYWLMCNKFRLMDDARESMTTAWFSLYNYISPKCPLVT